MGGWKLTPPSTVPRTNGSLTKPAHWDTLGSALYELRRPRLHNNNGHRHLHFPCNSRSRVRPSLVHTPDSPLRHMCNRPSSCREEVVGCRGWTWPRTPLALINNATAQSAADFRPRPLNCFKIPAIRFINPPQSLEADAQRRNHLALWRRVP